MRGYKVNHLAINSTTAVAAEARVNPALPATAVVEFMAKWLTLYPRTVCQCTYNCCPTGRSSHVVEHDVFGGIVQFFPPEHAVVEGHSHVLVDKLKDHSCHFYIHIRFKKQVMVYQVWPLTQFFSVSFL